MMGLCRFIECNKYTTLVEGVDSRGWGVVFWGVDIYVGALSTSCSFLL